jgi:hypothetical protein
MDAAMPAQTLERCPNCAADLHALRPPNRCPACAFEYDEHTRVWRSDESWGRLALVYTSAGLVVGTIISGLYRLSLENAPYPALPLILGLLAPAAGLFLRRLISGRITGRFVALTLRGLCVGTRPTPLLVPWEDVEQLTEQRGVLKVRRHSSTTLVPLDDIFGSAAEVALFEAAFRDAVRRHGGRPGPPPTTVA